MTSADFYKGMMNIFTCLQCLNFIFFITYIFFCLLQLRKYPEVFELPRISIKNSRLQQGLRSSWHLFSQLTPTLQDHLPSVTTLFFHLFLVFVIRVLLLSSVLQFTRFKVHSCNGDLIILYLFSIWEVATVFNGTAVGMGLREAKISRTIIKCHKS